MNLNTSNIRTNCTTKLDLRIECYREMLKLAKTITNQLWRDYKYSEEYMAGADLYTTVILGLFALIIILLMFRSIKSTETLDDQVALLLCSMQMRVDYEENVRQKKKMREAKFRAQLWLNEIKNRGIRKLSNRGRSTSFSVPRARDSSICSVPTPIRFSPFRMKPPLRAKSYQGKLPAIVVEDEKTVQEQLSVSSSRPISRQSSVLSYPSESYSVDQEIAFQFPDLATIPL